jgi:ABC-type multidrug transport system ATPase subunit
MPDVVGVVPGDVAALSLRGVSKHWRAAAARVLNGVDLEVEAGTAVAIDGANGAGKTTLLRIIAGLLLPDSGEVRLAGRARASGHAAYHRELGLLSAGDSGLYGRLKVEHHLELWTSLALMPRSRRRPAAAAAVDAFELGPLCGRRVDRLSMGERQRLRLALAFAHEPRVVLLDEPVTSLDEAGVDRLEAALDALKRRGGAAVVCLPSGWRAPDAVDRHLTLAGGRLVDS